VFIHLKTIAQNGNRIKCVFIDEPKTELLHYVCLKRRDVDNVRETKSLLIRTTPNASSRGHLKVFNTVETHNMH
jgi:hypothetical protein